MPDVIILRIFQLMVTPLKVAQGVMGAIVRLPMGETQMGVLMVETKPARMIMIRIVGMMVGDETSLMEEAAVVVVMTLVMGETLVIVVRVVVAMTLVIRVTWVTGETLVMVVRGVIAMTLVLRVTLVMVVWMVMELLHGRVLCINQLYDCS